MARIYYFSGGWATAAQYFEGTSSSTGTTATISASSVVSAGAERLGIALVGVADDNAVADFTGESGGGWAEAVAEFTTTAGSDGALQLQTASLTAATTISGGAYTMAAADPWLVTAFALKPETRSFAVGAAAGTSTATATGIEDTFAAGNAAGVGAATAGGLTEIYGAGNAEGTSSAAGVPAIRKAWVTFAEVQFPLPPAASLSVGNAEGVATATAASVVELHAAGNAEGSSSAVAESQVEIQAVGNAEGTSDAQALSAADAPTTGTAEGTSTASAVSTVEVYVSGNAEGTGTANATSLFRRAWVTFAEVQFPLAAAATGAGTAAGTSTATAVGLQEGYAAGTAAGAGTATADARAEASAAGVAAGTGAATAVGQVEASSQATASGTSTVTAVGMADVHAAGNAEGTSTATAVGTSLAEGAAIGSASGTSTATAESRVEVYAVGNAEGVATVIAVGDIFVPPSVVETVRKGGKSRRKVPRYIWVDPEMTDELLEPVVPFKQKEMVIALPQFTSFEAGLEPSYIKVVEPGRIKVKDVPPDFDDDDEWFLMH